MSTANGFLAGYSFGAAAYVVILTLLSLVLTVVRTRSWGVSFTPLDLIRTLLSAQDRKTGGFKSTIRVVADSTYHNVFRLRRAGAWCNEAVHVDGRALVLYGSIGLIIASILGFISYHAGTGLITGVLLGLESISGVVFAAGGFILIFRRAKAPNIRAVTHKDTWALQGLIILLGVSSALSSVYGLVNPTASSSLPHIITLVVLGAFLLYAPFSELAFLIWKGALITLKTVRGDARKGESNPAGGGQMLGEQR
ncbi:hypothetical protein B9Q09_03690 [Candidatus Marsarchaeota G2 archaeon ECH_B_SAG-C16]|jgi:hypothetical protein|uniref:NarG-like domain-containing protein n=5 Tax=Candidatus Marsarchaeota group 2 TaxID=2203771 RepID=A0A2R6CA84_9ARCH|nr:MAG: hypothetical protein B9Q09_03690 [Candidatus Marsarchaeota G2 archaeon ECH_B_SAG-C16]PSN95859.1 MAG: hypothetical protein B9Q06_04590 [Candidatus Marsarchaeota G2 archaeon ECH_B_2]PSO00629.1 MAG: hypothetical protein B9Q07_03420 [Candidatus Marsarchaeota G2 archaeon ECH_B_3]PSO03225.1 MAG: hypothetical protein B9Q05_02465 [Candidatus Marsarchaeota G2 archaeon ECH_B_1]PSO07784.1 MAG: hypothetical protein B9Q04_09040 [Candidatus Marsarchaeota G2 archaeon BE_D]